MKPEIRGIGVLAAMFASAVLGAIHGAVCGLARVNDIALGNRDHAFAGTGVAFFFGKPYSNT